MPSIPRSLGVVPIPIQTSNPYPVAATGFLFGTLATCILFGIHVGQVVRYYHLFSKNDKKRYKYALVPVVFGLSAVHIALVIVSAQHYYVDGINNIVLWGEFYWGLSSQDLLIPTISFVSHLFFGYRVWVLSRIRKLYWYIYISFVVLTFGLGVVFAALARIWSRDPWVSDYSMKHRPIAAAADVLPTVWLSCAAAIDGTLTVTLMYLLMRESHEYKHTKRLVGRIVQLTVETVLVTHAIGATLFILWLTSRTRSNAFWFFIEVIGETYSLSILFTLNSRNKFRKSARPDSQYMMDLQLDMLERIEAQNQQGTRPILARKTRTRSDTGAAGRPSVTLGLPQSDAPLYEIETLQRDATRPTVSWSGVSTDNSGEDEKEFKETTTVSADVPDRPEARKIQGR